MRRKPLHVFLLHACFLLALFGVLPGAREIYPRLLHAAGNSLFGSFSEGLSVHFESVDPTARRSSADTNMIGREHGRIDYRFKAVYSSVRRGYWPSATLLALILAVPMTRRRMAAVLPIGFAIFNAFFLLEIAAVSAVFFAATSPDHQRWERAVPLAEALFNSPVTNYAVVFGIWVWLARPARSLDVDVLMDALRRLLSQRSDAPPSERDGGDPPD